MAELNKLLVLLVLLLFSSACGYTPIYSKKDVHFNINNISSTGDKNITQKINEKLSNYKNKSDKEKQVNLVLNSEKNIIVALRNNKGEAQSYKMTIKVVMNATFENNKSIERIFLKTTNYNATERVSKLKDIENRLTSDLSAQIANEIILNLLED